MVEANQYQPKISYNEDVSFTASTTSDVQDLSGCTLCGLYIPSGFSGASIKFESHSAATGTFSRVIGSDGAELNYTVAASKYLYVDPAIFAGIRFLKLVSDATETANITLALRPV